MPTVNDKNKLYVQRLKAGLHIGPDYEAEPDKDGNYPSKTFKAGSKIYDKKDLATRDPERYEPLGQRAKASIHNSTDEITSGSFGGGVITDNDLDNDVDDNDGDADNKASSTEELQQLSIAELRKYATDRNIAVNGTTKAQIINSIVQAERE